MHTDVRFLNGIQWSNLASVPREMFWVNLIIAYLTFKVNDKSNHLCMLIMSCLLKLETLIFVEHIARVDETGVACTSNLQLFTMLIAATCWHTCYPRIIQESFGSSLSESVLCIYCLNCGVSGRDRHFWLWENDGCWKIAITGFLPLVYRWET